MHILVHAEFCKLLKTFYYLKFTRGKLNEDKYKRGAYLCEYVKTLRALRLKKDSRSTKN